jgi:hypothetical protein
VSWWRRTAAHWRSLDLVVSAAGSGPSWLRTARGLPYSDRLLNGGKIIDLVLGDPVAHTAPISWPRSSQGDVVSLRAGRDSNAVAGAKPCDPAAQESTTEKQLLCRRMSVASRSHAAIASACADPATVTSNAPPRATRSLPGADQSPTHVDALAHPSTRSRSSVNRWPAPRGPWRLVQERLAAATPVQSLTRDFLRRGRLAQIRQARTQSLTPNCGNRGWVTSGVISTSRE